MARVYVLMETEPGGRSRPVGVAKKAEIAQQQVLALMRKNRERTYAHEERTYWYQAVEVLR